MALALTSWGTEDRKVRTILVSITAYRTMPLLFGQCIHYDISSFAILRMNYLNSGTSSSRYGWSFMEVFMLPPTLSYLNKNTTHSVEALDALFSQV